MALRVEPALDTPDCYLSIVIPSYRGEAGLRQLLPRLMAVLSDLLADSQAAEVLVVDDGSGSSAQESLHRLLAELSSVSGHGRPELQALCLPSNRGQQEATLIGLAYSHGELVVTMDDDGEHPPEVLPGMLDRISNGADLVYAAPVPSRERPLYRRAGTFMNNLLFRLFARKPWDVPVTSFRAIRGAAVRRALAVPVRFPYLSAMLFATEPRPSAAAVWYPARPGATRGGSRYSLRQLARVFAALLIFWGPLRPLGRFLRPELPFDAAGGCL